MRRRNGRHAQLFEQIESGNAGTVLADARVVQHDRARLRFRCQRGGIRPAVRRADEDLLRAAGVELRDVFAENDGEHRQSIVRPPSTTSDSPTTTRPLVKRARRWHRPVQTGRPRARWAAWIPSVCGFLPNRHDTSACWSDRERRCCDRDAVRGQRARRAARECEHRAFARCVGGGADQTAAAFPRHAGDRADAAAGRHAFRRLANAQERPDHIDVVGAPKDLGR